ncbi:hypothetical protein [Desulfovibrio litoralis]|nr:hypothetical protein [Desulfovibrio litoralis]
MSFILFPAPSNAIPKNNTMLMKIYAITVVSLCPPVSSLPELGID